MSVFPFQAVSSRLSIWRYGGTDSSSSATPCTELTAVSRIGDAVTITDGISFTNRKQFRLHTIDRSGQDPRAYIKKAPEWVRMENKAKALVDRATKAQEARQANADRREKERESYTRRMVAAGIGAGRGVLDGLSAAGKGRTSVPGLGASKGAKQSSARQCRGRGMDE